MADPSGRGPAIIAWGRNGWLGAAPASFPASSMKCAPFLVIIEHEDGSHEIARCETLDAVASLKQKALTGAGGIFSVNAFVRIG